MVYISPGQRERERLEKHSGSSSKSRRSAAKPQPSWQRRYGISNGVSLPRVPQQCKRGPVTQKLNHLYAHLYGTHSHTSSSEAFRTCSLCILMVSLALLQIQEEKKISSKDNDCEHFLAEGKVYEYLRSDC